MYIFQKDWQDLRPEPYCLARCTFSVLTVCALTLRFAILYGYVEQEASVFCDA